MKQNVLKLFFVVFLLGFSSIQAQTVTGTITDATDGMALPGVSIVIKGTTKGTSSDFDGNYSVTLTDSNAVLQFSYLGYTTKEVAVNGKTVINVALEPSSEALDEVVVTALGIKRSTKALGYSVTEIKGDEIAKEATINPINALEGKVAGVEIDLGAGGTFGGSRIQIRGNSTLGSNNQPIFVIDGMILDNSTSGGTGWGSVDWGNELKNLNPDDFESISVLKGASATALYGSRAINGVVLITTKKGDTRVAPVHLAVSRYGM